MFALTGLIVTKFAVASRILCWPTLILRAAPRPPSCQIVSAVIPVAKIPVAPEKPPAITTPAASIVERTRSLPPATATPNLFAVSL